LGAPNHCGGANWIFSDSTSGGRVACEVARVSGEVDGVRLPKEAYYVCQAMFRTDPQVHIIGHWNYPAGTKKTVYVASNGDVVELFVNGKSLGRAEPTDRYLFTFPDVVWAPGEIKAVAYTNQVPAATATLRTAGPAVALRVTPITGPGGLQADGSDVALFDVEAVDAQGERCPTVQQRVDFELTGPATWLGGYNSGKTNSVHRPFVDLECGINRVAIRAGRQPGTITLRARSEGLQPANLAIEAAAFEVAHGASDQLPRLPLVKLPVKNHLQTAAIDSLPAHLPAAETAGMTGRFTKAFSYSGPTTIVHVETQARAGKNVYVDRDFAFPRLPAALNGADWVQAANSDARYSAVDLMEIAVAADTVILIAHDDRLPRPAWLTDQFTPANSQITIDGQAMHLFSRRAERDESLTLGPNAGEGAAQTGNMYVVFVNRLPQGHADVANRAVEQNPLAVTE
jgi:beta-galactosidase